MYSHKRTLWPDMQRWRAQAAASEGGVFPLVGGTLAVADAESARAALLGPQENFLRQSAFLRLGLQALSEQHRVQAVQGLLTVLGRHDGDTDHFDLDRVIRALGGEDGRLSHQGWGVRAVHGWFAPSLAYRRSPEISKLVNTYVCESTIASAVVGRATWRTRRTEFALRRQFADHLTRLPAPEGEPNDLIDVVLGLDGDYSPIDRAQLLQRLILSTVGFTGITLEWAVLLAYQGGLDSAGLTDAEARALVQEALRLYPTAWRLWRTVEQPHEIGGCPVKHGGGVMIDLHTIHRSGQVWDEPDTFDPERWSRATREQRAAFMPFGKGEQMCPAGGFALRALEELTGSILREYRGVVQLTGRHPHARTLLAPPRGWTQVVRREA